VSPRQTGLLRILEDLEHYAQSLPDNGVALANVRETRMNLQRLADKMDALEAGFDRIAERSRMSYIPLYSKLDVYLDLQCCRPQGWPYHGDVVRGLLTSGDLFN
jgi:hypothetical protein